MLQNKRSDHGSRSESQVRGGGSERHVGGQHRFMHIRIVMGRNSVSSLAEISML